MIYSPQELLKLKYTFRLPDECYEFMEGGDQVASESTQKIQLEKIEVDNGIFVYVKGAIFPYKNFPLSEAVFNTNKVKAVFIESIKILSKWYFIPVMPFLIKDIPKLLESFNRIGDKIIRGDNFKYQYLSVFARELHLVIFTFLVNYGIIEQTADKFATIFVHIIDQDNAYRLRLVDLFSATSRENLTKKPIREIRRLINISRDRDSEGVSKKFVAVAKLFTIFLLIPKIRRAFKKSLDVDFKKLQYDENDTYWVMARNDYKFMGLTKEQKEDYIKLNNWTYPETL